VSISLDESFFGTTKKIKFKRMGPPSDMEWDKNSPPPPHMLTQISDEIEIEIPKGSIPSQHQVVKERGHDIPKLGKGDLVLIYVDEEEYKDKMGDASSQSSASVSTSNDESSYESDENETDENSDEDNESDAEDNGESAFDDIDSSDSEEEKAVERKYIFRRGDGKNLEATFKITLNEFYDGVERTINYFGNKQINFCYYDKINLDEKYVIPSYGIDGGDMIISFELELPQNIPEQYKQQFNDILQKIYNKPSQPDFSNLDSEDIIHLIPQNEQDNDFHNMQDDMQNVQCVQQ
jgi:DnaJ-class molecular chaperone